MIAPRLPWRPSRHRWQPATSPVPPRRPPRLVTVDDAYLTQTATGSLATIYHLDQWFRGAVYDADGRLVRASQRTLGDPRGTRVAADPDTVQRRPDLRPLEGTWLYGGTWASVFGHFVVETLTTLWPTLDERPAGLVFHSNFGRTAVADWHRRFLELAGWGGVPLHVVGTDEPVTVERLLVPGRAVSLHAWAHPEARQVWERVAAGFRDAGGPERVYISRSLLNAQRRRDGHRRPIRTTAEHDDALDAVFAERGFEVFHPQAHDVDAQLRTIAAAEVVAGLSGSGLHQSAFMRAGRRVVEIGDGRTAEHPVPMQVAIDAASDHERCFVSGSCGPGDVSTVLRRLGL